MKEVNFRWTEKLQSFIYRIYHLMEIHRNPLHTDSDRFAQEIISTQARILFSQSSITNYNLSFIPPDLNMVSDIDRMSDFVFKLFFNIGAPGEYYEIIINLSKDKRECCSVHSINGKWQINDVNIFDIKFVDEIYIEETGQIYSPGKQDLDFPIVNTNSLIRDIPSAYMRSGYEIVNPYGVSGYSGRSGTPRKEEVSFSELKNKITEMAADIREHDSKNK